jgi:Lrp/AsnC family leucine-responsive transcriptional regulator
VIAGYRAVVDRSAVGLGLTVFVEIKAGKHSRDNAARLSKGLADMPEIVSCHLISGTADFLAEVVVPDLAAYERFMLDRLLALPTVEDVRSYFAIRTLKTAAPLPLVHLG